MTKPKNPVPSAEVAAAMAAPAAVEGPVVKEDSPPSYVKLGVTAPAELDRIRVLDAETGTLIAKVIEADAEAGRVVRYAVKNGALVRDGDRYQTIEEERPIRIEWSTGNQKDSF
ncbi:MAG: hypothetical protein C0494_16925 [Sphingobium sp.]|nr:hypothetical protein [Sphingobium sp.]